MGAATSTLRPAGAKKENYIYTLSTWVHSENQETAVTDMTLCTRPAELVAWRVGIEEMLVANAGANWIAVCPALLYGCSGSLMAPLFEAAPRLGKM